MAKYRKKPVVIEAFKWTGGHDQTEDPTWIVEALKTGEATIVGTSDMKVCVMQIKALEGTMTASPGDYIIKGVQGEICPCKPDIFEKTYVSVDEASNEITVVTDEDELIASISLADGNAIVKDGYKIIGFDS